MNENVRGNILRIAMVAICVLALIGVTSLCLTMFYRSYADPAVLTAIISITSTLIGALTGIITLRPGPEHPTPPPQEPVDER